MRVALILLDALTFVVLTATDIAELIAAPARNMIAPLCLLNPEVALAAALGTYLFGPGFELIVLGKLHVVDCFGFCFDCAPLVLLASHLDMISNFAA